MSSAKDIAEELKKTCELISDPIASFLVDHVAQVSNALANILSVNVDTATQTANQILGYEIGINRLRTDEESILANAHLALLEENKQRESLLNKSRYLNEIFQDLFCMSESDRSKVYKFICQQKHSLTQEGDNSDNG